MDSESTPQPAKAIRNEAPDFQKNVLESSAILRRGHLLPHETGHQFDKNNQPIRQNPPHEQFNPTKDIT